MRCREALHEQSSIQVVFVPQGHTILVSFDLAPLSMISWGIVTKLSAKRIRSISKSPAGAFQAGTFINPRRLQMLPIRQWVKDCPSFRIFYQRELLVTIKCVKPIFPPLKS